MNNIKYRAWDVEQKIMTNVSAIYPYEHTADVFWFEENSITNRGERVSNFQFKYPERLILMQFTGLKDKNGREIFEGDIMQLIAGYEYGRDYRLIVVWDDKKARWSVEGSVGSGGSHRDLDHGVNGKWGKQRCEIIGDIYENPELME